MTQYETFESESFPGEFEEEQPSAFETEFGDFEQFEDVEFEQFEDEEEVRRGGGGARPRAGGGGRAMGRAAGGRAAAGRAAAGRAAAGRAAAGRAAAGRVAGGRIGRWPCRRRSCAWRPNGRAFSRWRLGRPANGTRWSTGRWIARPTSWDDAPRSRLAQAALSNATWARRPGVGPGHARPSGAGPRGTRSGGARPGWAGSSAARPSLARSPMAASVLAGGRDLRLWRGARGRAGRAFAVRRIRARSLDAGLPEPGDAGRPAGRRHPVARDAQRRAQLPAARESPRYRHCRS